MTRLVLALLLLAGSAHADRLEKLDALRLRVQDSPYDVDARLELATLLSWIGDREGSRRQVEAVLAEAPEYWEAVVLMARLDAWDGDYEAARRGLDSVPKDEPGLRQRQELEADIAIWSEDHSRALARIDRLLTEEKSAPLYLRLATVELQRRHHFGAYLAVKKALDLNPLHPPSRQLLSELQLVRADVVYEAEFYPTYAPADRVGQATIVSATWLPRSRFSGTLTHIYRYRFQTHNSRLLLRGDWRATKDLTVFVEGGFGLPAIVVSAATVAAGVRFPFLKIADMGARYTWDKPGWGGHLHRLRADVGVGLPGGFQAEVAYSLGLVTHCGTVDDAHSLAIGGGWRNDDVHLRGRYWWGRELDKPERNASEGGLFDDEGCGVLDGDAVLALPEFDSHTLALSAAWTLHPRVTLTFGYDLGLRHHGTTHTTRVALRTWF